MSPPLHLWHAPTRMRRAGCGVLEHGGRAWGCTPPLPALHPRSPRSSSRVTGMPSCRWCGRWGAWCRRSTCASSRAASTTASSSAPSCWAARQVPQPMGGGPWGFPPAARTPRSPLPLPKVAPAPLGATPTPPPCGAGELWCGDGCVGASRRCDGVADCAGGADEAGCKPPPTAVPTRPARYPHCWGPLGACAPTGAGVWGAGPLTARLYSLQPPGPHQRWHPGEPRGWGGMRRGAGGGSG